MKKYMPGFVPVNFKQSGKALLVIGLAFTIVKLFSNLTRWFFVSNYFIYFGIGLMVLSLYLIMAVPKE